MRGIAERNRHGIKEDSLGSGMRWIGGYLVKNRRVRKGPQYRVWDIYDLDDRLLDTVRSLEDARDVIAEWASPNPIEIDIEEEVMTS